MIYLASHMHDEFVTLTDDEFKLATRRGSDIQQSSDRMGIDNKRPKGWAGVAGERSHQIGQLAECAVAKALGIPWKNSLNTFKRADLRGNIEVRLIGADWYGLRVYERDNGTRRVVGCIIERGKERQSYRLPGWIHARDGKRQEFLMDPLERMQPMYSVPQYELRSLEVLRRIIHANVPNDTPPRHLCAWCWWEPVETLRCDRCNRHYCYDHYWTHSHAETGR